jgi:hypothetical protein
MNAQATRAAARRIAIASFSGNCNGSRPDASSKVKRKNALRRKGNSDDQDE